MQSAPCLPRVQIRGPPDICHILRCTMATSSDHGCLELASRGEAFPTAGTSRAYALQLQVPHHKTDTEGIPLSGSQTASFVSKHSHKEAHGDRFVAREESWYCSTPWWWPACRCQQWTRCLSCRYVCSPLSSFGKPQSLPDLVEPPAFGTVQQSQVGTLLSREERRSLPVTTHLPAAGPSHISSPFA